MNNQHTMMTIRQIVRQYIPKRFSECITLISLSTTFFLFLHSRDLNLQLSEEKLRHQDDHDVVQENDEHFHSREISTAAGDDSEDYSQLDPMTMNNTVKAKNEILFFNRVPKVGSQTIMELLKQLSVRNSYHYHKDKTQKLERIKLSYSKERLLSNLVSNFDPPAVYSKHVCFSNFTKFGLDMPIYLNMVRDPVERVIAWYYYIRAPWYYVERKRAFPELPLPESSWLKKDYETCVKSHDPECRYIPGDRRDGFGDHRRQTMFFCGHSEDCVGFNTDIALRKAKENVEKHYAVVGVLEEMNKTLTVLEHYVPRFFKGANDVYYNQIQKFSKINRNIYKPPVSEETKVLVRQNFTKEIEFFEFCKQRLHKQYMALKLHKIP